MIRARLSPRAERDLDEICYYIAAGNADAATRVRHTILDIADFLALNPALGRRILKATPRHAAVRWLVVPKYRNYLIFYQPFENTIVVVRVLHAARDWTRFFPASSKNTG